MTTDDPAFRSSRGRRHLAVAIGFAAISTLTACSSGSKSATSPVTTAPATSAPTTAAPVPPSSSAPPATTETLSSALTSAYTAETGTLATYRHVVAALGSVGPFPNVISSEEQHVATVTALLNRYSITVPAAATGQPSPATLRAACALGVTSEQQIISFYTDQLPKVSTYAGVATVFQNLLTASRDSHLPAFQHCA